MSEIKKIYCRCGFSCKKTNYFNEHCKKCSQCNSSEIVKETLNVILENCCNENTQVDAVALNNWWLKYSDRKFMVSLYKNIGEHFNHLYDVHMLDIGFEDYNYINKDLINNNNIKYTQIEPFPDDKKYKNDILLKGFVQDLKTNFIEYENYFDIVCDFGVLGAPAISRSYTSKEIEKYIDNILHVLKDNGIYILKLDKFYHNEKNFALNHEEHFLPHFKQISFESYQHTINIQKPHDGRRPDFTERDQYKFYFYKKIAKKEINKLVIVAHPDDESIWCSDKLDDKTHVVVVCGDNRTDEKYRLTRKKEFSDVMSITNSSYEIWNLPEKKKTWSILEKTKLEKALHKLLNNHLNNTLDIYTHNSHGEYGHLDHILVHKMVLNATNTFLQNANNIKNKSNIRFFGFNPHLNYEDSNLDNRLNNIKSIPENPHRKLLLDQYKSQSVDKFRTIVLNFEEFHL